MLVSHSGIKVIYIIFLKICSGIRLLVSTMNMCTCRRQDRVILFRLAFSNGDKLLSAQLSSSDLYVKTEPPYQIPVLW